MKICPTCNAQVTVLIVNVQNGQRFCHYCAETVCPTVLPGLVYTLEDVKLLRDCGVDPEVGKIEDHLRDLTEHCKRSSGTERAWFRTREEAIEFASTNPDYHGDIPALCARCGSDSEPVYHLNRPKWLIPQWTNRDAHLLEQMGIVGPERMPGDLRCANCEVPFHSEIDFFILPSGKMVCGANCMPQND
jgi:hypothetical protein